VSEVTSFEKYTWFFNKECWRNTLGTWIFVWCCKTSEYSGVGLHNFHCICHLPYFFLTVCQVYLDPTFHIAV